MMNKNWQLKCVKAFTMLQVSLTNTRKRIEYLWEQHVHALYVGDYPDSCSASCSLRLCRCDQTFLVFCHSVPPTRAGDLLSFGTRYLSEVSEDEVGEKNAGKRTFLQTLIVMGLAICCYLYLWRTGLRK